MFDVLHTVINSVYVQTLPKEQATSVVTDFFRGVVTPSLNACEARPLTVVRRTSLSVSLSLSMSLLIALGGDRVHEGFWPGNLQWLGVG